MAKELVPAPDVKDMVIALKEKYRYNLSDVNVDRVLFWRDLAKKKPPKKYPGGAVIAYVQKVNDMDRLVNPNHDFHFVVNASFFDKMSPAQQHITALHESLHIGPIETDDTGIDKVSLNDHDVKEFYVIQATFGMNWKWDDVVRDPLEEEIPFVHPPAAATEVEEEDEETPVHNFR
jgi:hypothetical protein